MEVSGREAKTCAFIVTDILRECLRAVKKVEGKYTVDISTMSQHAAQKEKGMMNE